MRLVLSNWASKIPLTLDAAAAASVSSGKVGRESEGSPGRDPWSWPGSGVYHFLPHSAGQTSATQFCLDAKESCKIQSRPGQLLRSNKSTARERNMNLWQLVTRLWHITGSKTDHTEREVGLTLLTQNHAGRQSPIFCNYLFTF